MIIMDNTIKIDLLEVFKKMFGFKKEDNDIDIIEKEADKIRNVSDGISWEEFAGENKKIVNKERLINKLDVKPSMKKEKQIIQKVIGRDRE